LPWFVAQLYGVWFYSRIKNGKMTKIKIIDLGIIREDQVHLLNDLILTRIKNEK